ncbi:hypothetical protein GALMADRAFT_1303810 [Galerina marginata CBS 339.88]|uniref:Uncharacterized protein n=1 Tax=Galerina marginata (strain CBS 339.88) TaxID=685588 RepID=A0A067TE19_GALM3|nr:hypothetical protein GALMADRAFT_1303810 [Galerina marginata CBS 339.88]
MRGVNTFPFCALLSRSKSRVVSREMVPRFLPRRADPRSQERFKGFSAATAFKAFTSGNSRSPTVEEIDITYIRSLDQLKCELCILLLILTQGFSVHRQNFYIVVQDTKNPSTTTLRTPFLSFLTSPSIRTSSSLSFVSSPFSAQKSSVCSAAPRRGSRPPLSGCRL